MAENTTDHAWISSLTGGAVTRLQRDAVGSSRGTWLVDVERPGGERLELVLRRDTGDGPLSGTELSLARETAVYRALSDTDVLIPHLRGVSPAQDALLVERIPGTADYGTLTDPVEREAVATSFIDALATLHRVDVSSLDLPGFARPTTAAEHALCELALWRRIFEERVRRPAPLVRFALQWMERHAPASVGRTVLCHGDLGPGNYLFANGRVTALLDWEFAHLGDPMDDLAWLTIRAHMASFGDMPARLRQYATRSGIAVDPARVQYYQTLVWTRMAICCLAALDGRAGRNSGTMDFSTYFNLLPAFEHQAAQLLAACADVKLETAEIPAAARDPLRTEVVDTLLNDFIAVVMPAFEAPSAIRRVQGMLSLLTHLRLAQQLQPSLDAAECDDMAGVLGRRPASVEDGLAELDRLVTESGDARAPELIRYFGRQSARKMALWPAHAEMGSRPLERVRLS